VEKVNHLDDKQIVEAVIDENSLAGELRRHLFECSVCSAQRGLLEGRLARFGQISRGVAPSNFRKPKIVEYGAGEFATVWKIRPALGLGMVFATLFALLLSPLAIKNDKIYTQDVVYREMIQDERFMTEIENLEENPLPRFYVNMGEPSDEEGDAQQPGARMDNGLTNDGGSRNVS
jgi:hypothetical protein